MTYPHFIEVHAKEDGVRMSINIDNIIGFGRDGGTGTLFRMADRGAWNAAESYEESKSLLQAAGCGIAKADPRLDTSHPLTMEDLCRLEMIGEPVWNSNSRRWMLLIDNALDNRSWVDLINDSGKTVRFGPHDVQKFPLYRMRKDDEDL